MNQQPTKRAIGSRRRGPGSAQGKLAAIAEAAARVFTRQGWRLSQVADVAREAGVASGTVYLYAADKAALLDLAIRVAAGLSLPEGADAPAQGHLAETLAEALGPRIDMPLMRSTESAVPLRDILAELYDLMAREAPLILLLDRLRSEIPEIGAAYAQDLRATSLREFTEAVRQRAADGVIRRDVDAAMAARAVLEMMAWMAMRRPRDTAPPPGDEVLARETTLCLAEAALIGDQQGRGDRT